MLVLARKRDEAIRIGDDIVIKVIQCGRGAVRLGIQAPKHVRVLRGELASTILDDLPTHHDSNVALTSTEVHSVA